MTKCAFVFSFRSCSVAAEVFFLFLIENTVKELHIYSTFVSSRTFEVTELACESSLLF